MQSASPKSYVTTPSAHCTHHQPHTSIQKHQCKHFFSAHTFFLSHDTTPITITPITLPNHSSPPIMTSPIPHDDEDSLYDHPIIKPPSSIPSETILPPEQATHIDSILDSEETPPPSRRNSITSLSESDISERNNDIFDSDENHISTSTSASSSTTIPERPSRDEPPFSKPSLSKPAQTFLSRASATFYKAFRKKKSLPVPTPQQPVQPHETLVKLFEAQIATLRSARTGFVDLSMVTPMTRRTLEGVAQAGVLLGEFTGMERDVASLRRSVEVNGRETEAEIRGKEKILVDAKIRLAEVSEDVERLRHELRCVQRLLADPCRVDKRTLRQARKQAAVCREARKDVEMRLEEKTRELDGEKVELARVENDFRDIEGDWA